MSFKQFQVNTIGAAPPESLLQVLVNNKDVLLSDAEANPTDGLTFEQHPILVKEQHVGDTMDLEKVEDHGAQTPLSMI